MMTSWHACFLPVFPFGYFLEIHWCVTHRSLIPFERENPRVSSLRGTFFVQKDGKPLLVLFRVILLLSRLEYCFPATVGSSSSLLLPDGAIEPPVASLLPPFLLLFLLYHFFFPTLVLSLLSSLRSSCLSDCPPPSSLSHHISQCPSVVTSAHRTLVLLHFIASSITHTSTLITVSACSSLLFVSRRWVAKLCCSQTYPPACSTSQRTPTSSLVPSPLPFSRILVYHQISHPPYTQAWCQPHHLSALLIMLGGGRRGPQPCA